TQLQQIQNLLLHFSGNTGLGINFSKMAMYPINVDHAKLDQLAAILGCNIGYFPFTYLGLPLGTKKPKVEDFFPMMKRIERRLTGCSTLLSTGEKLSPIKSVFTSLPTFFMCSLELHATVVDQVNSYIRQCFWRKYGQEGVGPALIAWSTFCKPKEQGGLGVLDISSQ
uniref:Reverse transcriptase domain-containing protein n=1 Tax=Aegilops tauschii subsp. strangulata TaxID=200361 RepID=A0A453JDH2_AEGTS